MMVEGFECRERTVMLGVLTHNFRLLTCLRVVTFTGPPDGPTISRRRSRA